MKWIVNVNGGRPQSDTKFAYVNPDAGSSRVEISVLRDDNLHGRGSLGWGGPNKFILSDMEPLPPEWLFDAITGLAQQLADRLNAESAERIDGEYVERLMAVQNG